MWVRAKKRAFERLSILRGLGSCAVSGVPQARARMPDRLAEIRRQRALVAEHLAWLDREIAAAAPATAAPVAPTTTAVVPAPIAPPATAPSPLDPAAILAQVAGSKSGPLPAAVADPDAHPVPEHQPADIKNDVRRGCLLYFALASVAVVAGTAFLIWAARSPWFREEVSPYLTKAFFVALILALGAGIRSLASKIRPR